MVFSSFCGNVTKELGHGVPFCKDPNILENIQVQVDNISTLVVHCLKKNLNASKKPSKGGVVKTFSRVGTLAV